MTILDTEKSVEEFTEMILGITSEQLAMENARLRSALKKHGRHMWDCYWNGGLDCNCGWDDLKASL